MTITLRLPVISAEIEAKAWKNSLGLMATRPVTIMSLVKCFANSKELKKELINIITNN